MTHVTSLWHLQKCLFSGLSESFSISGRQIIETRVVTISRSATFLRALRICCVIALFTIILEQPNSHGLVTTGNSPFGIEINGANGSIEFDKAWQAGAHLVRLAGLWWPDVEPVEGKYNWSAMQWLESLFSAAVSRNMTVILVVRGTPEWAQKYSGHACGPIRPDKLNAFADFMAALVAKYGDGRYGIKYWELGNEPDIDPKLVTPDSLTGCWGDDADEYYGGGAYARMLQVVYPRIKEVNPTAQVLLGGLVLDCDPRPDGGCPDSERSRPPRFLEGVLRAGGGSFIDGVSFHSYDYYDGHIGRYSNSNWHSDSVSTGPVSLAKAAYIRSLFQKYGVKDKALLNTESALLCSRCTNDSDYESTKALYAASVNAAALSADLSANIWFRMADWPDTELLAHDMSAKPAYTAFSASTRVLTGAAFERELTTAELRNDGLRGAAFSRYGENLWLVRSIDGISHTLTLANTPRSVRDVFGQSIEISGNTIGLNAPDRMFLYIIQ